MSYDEDLDKKKDAVNHPDHYKQGDIECIQAIEASMSLSAFQGFCKGNALKYIWRYKRKGVPLQDIDKAIWYLTRLRETLDV